MYHFIKNYIGVLLNQELCGLMEEDYCVHHMDSFFIACLGGGIMSNFLINHFARSVVKATRSQPKAKKSQSNCELDLETATWGTLGKVILAFAIVSVLIVIFLLVVSAIL